MSNTTTIYTSCINRSLEYAHARFCLKDPLPKYILKTLNLKKIQRDDLNVKINRQLQNKKCQCPNCNPDTSNMGR
jgi:hypothetical protein